MEVERLKTVILLQLRAEIGCLQEELHGKRAEMETLDTLLQRRERESQEGGNLLKMLTDDLQHAKEERQVFSLKIVRTGSINFGVKFIFTCNSRKHFNKSYLIRGCNKYTCIESDFSVSLSPRQEQTVQCE